MQSSRRHSRAKYNDRLLAQMDCLSRFKYDEGQRLGKDPTWKGALAAWIEQGYAKRFGDLFNPETPLPELYRLITSVPPIAPEPAGSVTPAPAP